jgi:hypothetical protein
MREPNEPNDPNEPVPTLTRRAALTTLAVGTLAPLALRAEAGSAAVPACRDPRLVPNVVVATDEGRRAWFLDDLLAGSNPKGGRAVLVHFTSEAGEREYPVLARVARVVELLAASLGPRMGEDVAVISISTDAERSTPHALAELAQRHRPLTAKRGWWFVSAEPRDLEILKSRFFEHAHDQDAHGIAGKDCSRGLFRYGNAALGLWGSVPAKAEPEAIAERLTWVVPRTTAATAGVSRRRGPRPLGELATIALLFALSGFSARSGIAQGVCSGKGHPYPQAQMSGQSQMTRDNTTYVTTGTSLFPKSEPFVDPPGTNLLPNVYTNNFDSNCDEMPNTLPSTPTVFYNLHDGEPTVSSIDRTSPTTDLENLLDRLDAIVARRSPPTESELRTVREALQSGIDILEGNPIPGRSYSGFPLLHFDGPNKYKKVVPIYGANGELIGGNVDIHQIWYDNHIESDTALLDPTEVAEVPWTITYTLDVLDRGKDDFSPFVMYYDAPPGGKGAPFEPGKFGPFNVGMDQTFFPIEEGTRTVLKIKMAPAKYFSLSYTWGWRWHPPRIQVLENSTKIVGDKTLLEWERSVFGDDPRANKRKAIGMIGDLAPAKVMWRAFCEALDRLRPGEDPWPALERLTEEARRGFEDWQDRTRLPHGVALDASADMTLFYVNNTMYAQFTDGGSIDFPKFQTRGAKFTVALRNGDYFDHAYMNVDFGGGRGWENQFKSSVKVGGSGCWFTFGRNYVAANLMTPVTIHRAKTHKAHAKHRADKLGAHRVEITFNFDPSRRLRFYQFDPTHHDVAIMSIH